MFATLQVYLYICKALRNKNYLNIKNYNMSNLKLWNKVEKTNPKYTKDARLGGMKITSINATWQIKQATEQFGTYGKGFGLSKIAYDIIPCHSDQIMAIYTATFFYMDGSERFEFPISTSIFIQQFYANKGYLKVDDNFAKKAETDMLTKALSKLGFNSDIFMGRYDDKRYVAQTSAEFQQEEKDKLKASRQVVVKAIAKAKTSAELKVVYNKYPSFKVDLKDAYALRGKELKEGEVQKVFADVKKELTPATEEPKYNPDATLEEVETFIANATSIADLGLIHTTYTKFKDDILAPLGARKNALNAVSK
jgi:hypothetical protein